MIDHDDKANAIFRKLASKSAANLSESTLPLGLKTNSVYSNIPPNASPEVNNKVSDGITTPQFSPRQPKIAKVRNPVKPRTAKLNPENAETYEEQVAIVVNRINDYLNKGNNEGLINFVTCWIDVIVDEDTGELDDYVKYELQNYSNDKLVYLVSVLLNVLR